MIHTAKVTAVYPTGHCDLILDTGRRCARVPIGSNSMATDGGFWGTPSVAKAASEQAASRPSTTGRNVIAIVAVVRTMAILLGFIHPSGTVMSFTEDDRMVLRHPKSGGYVTFAPDGSVEIYQNGGAYFRMGAGAHQDLAGVTDGAKWDATAGPAPTITIGHPHFTMTVDPSGNAVMTYASLTLNGNVQLNGTLNATGDGIFNNVSVDNHDHRVINVQTGGATIVTTAPVPGS